MPAAHAATSLLNMQRIIGDGSERWHWWFWGGFVLVAIIGMTTYMFLRWKMNRGD